MDVLIGGLLRLLFCAPEIIFRPRQAKRVGAEVSPSLQIDRFLTCALIWVALVAGLIGLRIWLGR